MKTLFYALVLLASASCAVSKTGQKSKALNGTWIPVKQELGGMSLPESMYKSQKLVLDGNSYSMQAESADFGDVKYDGNKMDIYGQKGVNEGKHFTAIYKYENGRLTICYNLAGDSYPEGFDTEGHPLFFLSVFERGEK